MERGKYAEKGSQQNSKLLNWSSGQTLLSEYTTKSWSEGSGGFNFSIPSAGWYYLAARFEAVSGQTMSIQTQLRLNDTRIENYGITGPAEEYIWRGSMPCITVATIEYCNAGDIITPYIHTETAGLVVRTQLKYVKIA